MRPYRGWHHGCAGTTMTMALPASASVIYQESFPASSSSPLNGTTPGVANNINGELNAGKTWSAGTAMASTVPAADAFVADGSANLLNATPNSTSAYLPFSPVSGNIYTYSATINVTLNQAAGGGAGTGSNWLGMGFTNTAIQATGSTNRWSADTRSNPSAAAWMLHRGAYNSTTDTTFGGPNGTNNVAVAAPAGTITDPVDVLITLDTSAAKWAVTWQIRDDTVGGAYTTIRNFTYTTNPTINNVGFTALASAGTKVAGKVSNMELDVTAAPEPATISLLAVAGLQMLRRRRR